MNESLPITNAGGYPEAYDPISRAQNVPSRKHDEQATERRPARRRGEHAERDAVEDPMNRASEPDQPVHEVDIEV